jgi:hypothetical protein
MIFFLYGRHYFIGWLFVDPSDQGHDAAAKFRIYVVLWRRGQVTLCHDFVKLYSAISSFIKRMVQTRPVDYMVSPLSEHIREAARLAFVRKKKLKDAQSLTSP